MSEAASVPGRRRRRWRTWLGGGLLAVMVLTLVGLFVRSLQADPIACVPASVEEGIVGQIFQRPGEAPVARCAVVLPHDLEEVWQVLNDYEHYGDICDYIHGARVTPEADGQCTVQADGDTLLGGRLPFAVRVRPERDLEHCVLSWETAGGPVANRGRWVLTRVADGTLLEVEQEVAVGAAPAFMVRAITLRRHKESLRRLQARLADGPSGKPW
jgi:hypothetical protein